MSDEELRGLERLERAGSLGETQKVRLGRRRCEAGDHDWVTRYEYGKAKGDSCLFCEVSRIDVDGFSHDPTSHNGRLAITKLHKLTKPVCAACPEGIGEDSCCSDTFCLVVEESCKTIGVDIRRTDHPRLPFMGPDGCVVPPQLRPGCSGFVCPSQRTDKLMKRHDRLLAEGMEDETIATLTSVAAITSRRVIMERLGQEPSSRENA